MTTGLINTYSTLNLGDAAIYSALASMMADQSVVAAFDDDKLRPVPGIGSVDDLSACDAYVSVGGDIFNNARKHLFTKKFLQNLGQLLNRPGSTLLFGQSIPRSCQGISFWMLAWTLKQIAAVCVRDQESYQRLSAAGVPVVLSYDTAFALTGSKAGQSAAQQIFDAIEIEPQKAVCLSVRAFDSMYMSHPEDCFGRVVALCQGLVKRGHRPVVVVQSQASKGEDDVAIANRLRSHVPSLGIFNPFTHEATVPDWDIAMGAFSLCRIAVGIRYHTSVLSLATGRMPFNIYYANKGQDLSDRLAVPGCAIEALDADRHISQIESLIDQPFDHETIRQHVRADFATCYQQTHRKIPLVHAKPTHAAP